MKSTCQSYAIMWELDIICSIMLVTFLGTTSTLQHSVFILSKSIYLTMRYLYLHIFRSTPPFSLRAPLPPSLEKPPSHWTAAMPPLWSSCFCSGPTTTWSLHTIITYKCKPGPIPAGLIKHLSLAHHSTWNKTKLLCMFWTSPPS